MFIQNLKKIKILFALLLTFCLLVYCDNPDRTARERANRERLGTKEDSPIRSNTDEYYYGRYNKSDYDGPECNSIKREQSKRTEYEECTQTCEKLYDNESNECERLPIDLISKLDQLFTEMHNIPSSRDDYLARTVNKLDFGVMIDIDTTPALTLIKDWSSREAGEFLIWTAKTNAIALAIRYHDRENDILDTAFKKLTNGTIQNGIRENLEGAGQTFLGIASNEKNAAAFIALHNLLKRICSDKNCKLQIYCSREVADRQRSPCHYSSSRRFNKSDHCYIQGPNVWNYWKEINQDGEFYDSDFSKEENLTEETCNAFCQNNSSC